MTKKWLNETTKITKNLYLNESNNDEINELELVKSIFKAHPKIAKLWKEGKWYVYQSDSFARFLRWMCIAYFVNNITNTDIAKKLRKWAKGKKGTNYSLT